MIWHTSNIGYMIVSIIEHMERTWFVMWFDPIRMVIGILGMYFIYYLVLVPLYVLWITIGLAMCIGCPIWLIGRGISDILGYTIG